MMLDDSIRDARAEDDFDLDLLSHTTAIQESCQQVSLAQSLELIGSLLDFALQMSPSVINGLSHGVDAILRVHQCFRLTGPIQHAVVMNIRYH